MLRRWLIRSLFLLLLLASISAWVFTFFYSVAIHYNFPTFGFGIALGGGHIAFGCGKFLPNPGLNTEIAIVKAPRVVFALDYLGFSPLVEPGEWIFRLPIVLVVPLCLLFCLIAWRKTRPRKTPAAFPIEPHPPAKTPST